MKNYNWKEYEQYTFERIHPNYNIGLRDEQVRERIEQGARNTYHKNTTRSVKQIVFDNTFTFFNSLNLVIAVIIISVGEYKNALFIGVATCNTFLSIFQEIRAKKTIDKLTIVSESKVIVIRDGNRIELNQDEIVLDDVMFVTTGSQICADGIVLSSQGSEMDESSITGESDFVFKQIDDVAMSGSFVATGSAYIKVRAIGKDNYAERLSKNSKYEKKLNSQLLIALNAIIKTLTIVIIPIGALLFFTEYNQGGSFEESVLWASAAVIGMIPEGLVLLTGIAFSVGAVNLGMKKTLVQAMPSIETLARVDVLCLDKTGTITDESLAVRDIIPLNGGKIKDIGEKISAVIYTLEDDNSTSKALKNMFKNKISGTVREILPFSSTRKYSGVIFEEIGGYLLGAPEFIIKDLKTELKEKINGYSNQGFRVLLIAKYEGENIANLEGNLIKPLGLILISDNIRKDAKETLEFFKEQRVTIKVISGDNPATVSNISAEAGLLGADRFFDLSKLDENAEESYYEEIVENYTVFGRVSPFQKQELIKALKRQGHTVGMMGDGINDCMALREADCSIAMASGNDAARHVSDFVLLNSNFGAMIDVVKEGRRVVNNIERVACLYLVKTMYSTILAIIFILIPNAYPFMPIQLTLISSLMAGIPSFFLALSHNHQQIKGNFIEKVLSCSLPAALTIVFNVLLIQFLGYLLNLEYIKVSTLSIITTTTMCFIILIKVSKPLNVGRILMMFFLGTAFITAFVMFKEFFSFADFSLTLCFLMLLLIFEIYPMFLLFDKLTNFINSRLKKKIFKN